MLETHVFGKKLEKMDQQRHPESNRGSVNKDRQKRALSQSARKSAEQPARGKPSPKALFGSPNPAHTGDAPPSGGTQCNTGEQAETPPANAEESATEGNPTRLETAGDDFDISSIDSDKFQAAPSCLVLQAAHEFIKLIRFSKSDFEMY